eukprot:CAMPEP_0180122900 /NCGR_PEP_ID=MMETSP0986-20121125/3835_1 /TAXON_ID=697907 /ORGANISM="non described non described, Strain CCMP2293" /LENGTH=82 /DNA_ID=CAMNT_0022062145 /DNA_START=63 /DNA_END=311 /DNA_ORIENTATION=-
MSDNESEDLPPPDKFGKFLMFGDEIAPVFDALTIEQAERRKLDAVRIEKTIIGIDRSFPATTTHLRVFPSSVTAIQTGLRAS